MIEHYGEILKNEVENKTLFQLIKLLFDSLITFEIDRKFQKRIFLNYFLML